MNAIMYPVLADSLRYQCGITITTDTLRHRIAHIASIKAVTRSPMEAEQIAVDPDAIVAWYADLARRIEDVPRRLIFNIDETGCSDFGDQRELTVLVPYVCQANSVPVPVSRHTKRSTLTACIAADGYRMRPFVIVDRLTANRELAYYGYDESNVTLVTQANAFMTSILFEAWAKEVFFPAVEERRRQWNYDGTVVLLLDGLGSHHTEKFLSDCRDRMIDVIFLVPHSSDQTQPLDLITFALLKQGFSSSRFNRLATPQSNIVVRIPGAWFAASAPHHNIEAFMDAGLIPVERNGNFGLSVQPENARRCAEIRRTQVRSIQHRSRRKP
jgi:hypothetical protein